MLEVLVRLLKNEDGFTATEVGLMAALTVHCDRTGVGEVLKRSPTIQLVEN